MKNTSLKRFLQPVPQSIIASAALFLIRLIAGAAFVLHGWGKIQTPFGWLPLEAPISIHPFFQFLAAISEFGGGIWLDTRALDAVSVAGNRMYHDGGRLFALNGFQGPIR